MKELGCQFIAFYGAECLYDFDKLPEVVGYAESVGIRTTVITSGNIPGFQDRIRILYASGLRSLTMSYDIVPLGNSSLRKMEKVESGLAFFSSLGPVRDRAIVVTLTRKNFQRLPHVIRDFTTKGIWTFFDFIHGDRGQPGSKCGPADPELLFQERDLSELNFVLEEVLYLKKVGFLCHASEAFLNKIRKDSCSILRNYNWNCACEKSFPSWVTIDCDGLVYPCDDFQPRDAMQEFPIDTLKARWPSFCSHWKPIVKKSCPGCCWNTHIDACLIKEGKLPITDYVHGSEG